MLDAKRYGPLYEQLVEKERESRTLAALRDTLLPKLISGELRIERRSSSSIFAHFNLPIYD